jgi:N-acetylmuramic acid 6-phosphate etherase
LIEAGGVNMNAYQNVPITEQRNDASANIDNLSPLELVTLINAEDKQVALAVERALPDISAAVEIISRSLRVGGRLIYVGAGTSGRLGVLDAAECPPTFSTPPDVVLGLIAGGEHALRYAVEGSEDSPESGADDLRQVSLAEKDVVVGIAASGRTPYVLGALRYARSIGARAIGLSCNPSSELRAYAEPVIEVVVGPEIISGSTRMKAGTAQKMVLNMLSTGAMVLLGKTYKNYMVDVAPTNDKLRRRAVRMVQELGQCDESEAERKLVIAGWDVKSAILMCSAGVDLATSKQALTAAQGRVGEAMTRIAGKQ